MTNSIDKFLGKFQLSKSENFDEYMKKIGKLINIGWYIVLELRKTLCEP